MCFYVHDKEDKEIRTLGQKKIMVLTAYSLPDILSVKIQGGRTRILLYLRKMKKNQLYCSLASAGYSNHQVQRK